MVTNTNIMKYLTELTNYAVRCGLTDENDRTYVINSLLSALNLKEYAAPDEPLPERDLHLILEDIIDWALEAGVYLRSL